MPHGCGLTGVPSVRGGLLAAMCPHSSAPSAPGVGPGGSQQTQGPGSTHVTCVQAWGRGEHSVLPSACVHSDTLCAHLHIQDPVLLTCMCSSVHLSPCGHTADWHECLCCHRAHWLDHVGRPCAESVHTCACLVCACVDGTWGPCMQAVAPTARMAAGSIPGHRSMHTCPVAVSQARAPAGEEHSAWAWPPYTRRGLCMWLACICDVLCTRSMCVTGRTHVCTHHIRVQSTRLLIWGMWPRALRGWGGGGAQQGTGHDL